MPGLLTLEFKSTNESMDSASDAAERWLADHGVSKKVQYFTSLAIEEWATNCMKYGYDQAKEHPLEVTLSLSETELILTLIDDGRPFNPLLVPRPNLNVAVEDRPTGGLGIYLLRELSDRMEYVRQENKNKVTLHKALPGA